MLSSPHMAAILAAQLDEMPARVDSLKRLLAHMCWADDRVAESLGKAEPRHDEAWELYAHVLGAEQIWLARILGTEAGAVWPDPTQSDLGAIRREVSEGYASLLDTIDDDELGLAIAYENSDGEAFQTPVEEILLHVFLHGAYHRGQVALLLRGSGAEPEPTDFIAFVRGAPAATSGDDRER